MGAPKQKWTAEEEDALKAGVVKHGAGKWRTILKDPEFSGILCLRSNVDLKDKWRNMSVIANGWGSRDRGKVVSKKSLQVTRGENYSAHGLESDFDGEIVDAKPIADEFARNPCSSRSSPRMENLILEAIISLNEPLGSDKTTIAMFIEDQYRSPPNFKEMLSNKLKLMTASGKLIKVKGAYRVASSSDFSEYKSLRTAASDGKRKELIGAERIDAGPFKKVQVDAGLVKTRLMNSQEADAAAARAVAEAEIAMAEAEEAAREAEAAEAEAEEKQAFAEAAIMTLRNRNAGTMIPGNTGCIARTCAASAVSLHLIEPLGYKVDDTKLKRAGLDYWPYVVGKIHSSWDEFREYFHTQNGKKRLLAFTKKGAKIHSEFSYRPGDWLVFGSETFGLSPEVLHDCNSADMGGGTIRIPMIETYVRCLNLSVSVGIALYEASRQLNYEQMQHPSTAVHAQNDGCFISEDIFA